MIIAAAGTTPALEEPAPEPAPEPASASAPALAQVVVVPASFSIQAGSTKPVAAYGRLSNGDSVAGTVTYSATGGTISSNGLFTAGAVAGTYQLIVKEAGGLADTASVTLAAPIVVPIVPTPVPSPNRGQEFPRGAFSLHSAGARRRVDRSI